jgi:hypothetical protein
MRKNLDLSVGLLAVFILASCYSGQDIDSQIGDTSIDRIRDERVKDIPFENEVVLKSFAGDPEILDFNTARRLALVEMLAVGFDEDMGWEGYRMNPMPVVIYGFDNRPRFYDFIVVDAEEQAAGTITVYARRAATTSIRSISSNVKDYRSALSKAGSLSASFFEDWQERSFVGIRGKSGDLPDLVFDAETSEVARGITEIKGAEIITALMNDEFFFELFTSGENGQTQQEVEEALYEALKRQTEQVKAFWAFIEEILPELEALDNEDEILDSSGKFLKSIISRIVRTVTNIVQGVDTSHHWIDRYTSYWGNFSPVAQKVWCGPWVVSYLEWIRNGRSGNTYDRTVQFTSNTLGFIFGGQPISPWGMDRALREVSGNRMSINTSPVWDDLLIYDRIRLSRRPAALITRKGNGLHWEIAVGARATGNVLFQTYHFLFHDNSTEGKNGIGLMGSFNSSSNRRDRGSEYRTVAFWNGWFYVND